MKVDAPEGQQRERRAFLNDRGTENSEQAQDG
jgi:hypothetical protein